MCRVLFLPAVLLVLSACDSSQDASPLIGTWQTTASETITVATSTVDQSVPDLQGEGTGRIRLTGDVTDELGYVVNVLRPDTGQVEEVEFSSVANPTVASGVVSVLSVVVNEGRFDRLGLFREGASRDNYLVQGMAGDPVPFRYQAGQFILDPTVLPATDGSGAQVTAGGTISFPLISLRAGQSATVRTQDTPPDDYTITFRDDGTFRVAPRGEAATTGTWRTVGTDQLILTLAGVDGAATYTIVDGALRITSGTAEICDDFCQRFTEGGLYAQPGSLRDIRYVQTDTFRRVAN